MFGFRIIVDGFFRKKFDDQTLEKGIRSFQDGEISVALKESITLLSSGEFILPIFCYAVVFKDDY